MTRVEAEINDVEVEGDFSTIDGVEATCLRCGHCTESAGTSEASVKRCLVLLREECPRGENNFYVAEGGI